MAQNLVRWKPRIHSHKVWKSNLFLILILNPSAVAVYEKSKQKRKLSKVEPQGPKYMKIAAKNGDLYRRYAIDVPDEGANSDEDTALKPCQMTSKSIFLDQQSKIQKKKFFKQHPSSLMATGSSMCRSQKGQCSPPHLRQTGSMGEQYSMGEQ